MNDTHAVPRLWGAMRVLKGGLLLPVLLAALLVMATPALALSDREEARVEAMLAALEQSKDVVFIRNGDEHTAAEAASHLRLKLSKTRNRLDSAEQFIDKVGSSSSISGRPYLVREPGKGERTANAFLHELLRRVAP